METVRIDATRCTLCGTCIPVCVRHILECGENSVEVTDPTQCILCGHCKAVCPEDAIQIPSLDAQEFTPIPEKGALPSPDSLMDLMRARRSIRFFKDRPVEKETLRRIVEAGRYAPTGGNLQPFRHVVVTNPSTIETVRNLTTETLAAEGKKLQEALGEFLGKGQALTPVHQIQAAYAQILQEMDRFRKQGTDRLFYHAPALVVTYANPEWTRSLDVDAGLCAMQMVLMAEAFGLGTCFIGFLVMASELCPEIKKTLDIPARHKVPVAFVAGYPDVRFLRLVSRRKARVQWL